MEKIIYHAKEDPTYQTVYVDVERWEERPDPNDRNGGTVKYFYVHGGFSDPEQDRMIKFSFCFPEKEKYQGHFFHYLCPFPGPDEEMASLKRSGADDSIAFALLHGAYFIETNMGSKFAFGAAADPSLTWKASAMSAEYSREYAMKFYGCGRPYGYCYGGSGGGYKSMACIENTDAWDGAAPFVIGCPVSLPNSISLHVFAQRMLRHQFKNIVDALDAGGSGDPEEYMDAYEKAAYREVCRMGFQPKSWFIEAEGRIDPGSLPVLMPGVRAADPSYFTDFWTVPGYDGANPQGVSQRDRLVFDGIVKSVHSAQDPAEDGEYSNGVDTAWKKQLASGNGAWIELEQAPEGDDLYLEGVNIEMTSGKAKGKVMILGGMEDSALIIGSAFGFADIGEVIGDIEPGDTVHLDNSDYIAVQMYYRHQVPDDKSFEAFSQFRDEEGNLAIPQRSFIMGYGFNGTGTVQDGNIQGKVIVNQSLMDEATWPWCAHWYKNKVIESKGSDEDFRLYWNENCLHGDLAGMQSSRIVNYIGALNQSLLDLSDWVEKGIEPKKSAAYEYKEGQIFIEQDPEKRFGLQPKVTLTVNGAKKAVVKPGEAFTLEVLAEVPQGAGKVTAFDFTLKNSSLSGEMPEEQDGTREDIFDLPAEVIDLGTDDQGVSRAKAVLSCSLEEPGTHFAAVRVKSSVDGSPDDIFTQILNLDRARIVVE